MRPHGSPRRKGFSVFELLVVLAVISIMVAIGIPKARSVRDRANLRAARDQVAAALTIARAAAVQKGQTGRFTLLNNKSVQVTLPDASQTVLLARDLDDLYGATVTTLNSADLNVDYDARGFAVNKGQCFSYTVTVNGATQTVSVSKLGLVLKTDCSPIIP